MAKYKEQVKEVTTTITEYVRASSVEMMYPLNTIPEVTFQEELIRVVDNGPPKAISYIGNLKATLTPDNANTNFDLKHPDTGVVVGSMTYEEVYGVMYSLYIHLATERDNKNN